jgi:hypothetical protein
MMHLPMGANEGTEIGAGEKVAALVPGVEKTRRVQLRVQNFAAGEVA